MGFLFLKAIYLKYSQMQHQREMGSPSSRVNTQTSTQNQRGKQLGQLDECSSPIRRTSSSMNDDRSTPISFGKKGARNENQGGLFLTEYQDPTGNPYRRKTMFPSSSTVSQAVSRKMTGTLFSDYKNINAGIGNIRTSYIPSFEGLEEIDYTPDSQKKVKSGKRALSQGWTEIAKGVIGPFAPKHSAFHKHLYDSRKARIRFEKQKQKNLLGTGLNQHQRVTSNSSAAEMSGVNTSFHSKKVNFSVDGGVQKKKQQQILEGPRLGKYENMMESLNKLKQSTSQSMQMLQTIKDRLERSVERKRKNVPKKEKPVRVILGPDGPICPIDQNVLLRAQIKRWRQAKEARRMERIKIELNPFGGDKKVKKIKRFRSATLLGKRALEKKKQAEMSSPPVSKSHGTFKPLNNEDMGRQRIKDVRVSGTKEKTRIKNLQKAYRDTREQVGTHPSSPHGTSEEATFISERGARLSGATSIKSQHFITAPSQLPSKGDNGQSKDNNRSYTPNYRKSRRLLGIYQISIINMMRKAPTKKLNVSGIEEKKSKLRDQAYNLAPLRSHINISDSKRVKLSSNALSVSYSRTPKQAAYDSGQNRRQVSNTKIRVSFPSLEKLNYDIKK